MNQDQYKAHWDNLFQNKDTSQVSWFQDIPKTSINLIDKYAPIKTAAIIDIGGGDSKLPDHLLKLEYKDIALLDISTYAIEQSRKRLGKSADLINWINSNILDFESKKRYQLWHDRAVYHFITDPSEQARYKEVLTKTLEPSGIAIIAGFSKNNDPIKCSGLVVSQQDRASIAKTFAPEFEIIEAFEALHSTPSGGQQNFNWTIIKRKSS